MADKRNADDKLQHKPKGIPWLKISALIISTLYLATTALILCETKEAVRQSRLSSERQERAWITPTGLVTFIDPAEENALPQAEFTVINTGHTPAIDVDIAALVAYVPGKNALTGPQVDSFLNEFRLDKNAQFTPFFLGPGSPFKKTLKLSRRVRNPKDVNGQIHLGDAMVAAFLTKEDANQIRDGLSHIVALGLITYRDIFSCKHTTTFCSYVGGADVVGELESTVCPSGNTVDDANVCEK